MPNTNTIRCNLGPITRSHLFEGELIHWVGKAKNVWPIVRRLPTGTKWWDGPLALPDFRRNNIQDLQQSLSPLHLLGISLRCTGTPFFLFQDYQQIDNAILKTEMQRILSLSEHEALELQNSNTESVDGLAFFPINSWPRVIRTLFHKSEIGVTDTFKFILFAFGNNISPIYSWIFFSLNTRRILASFPNESSKHWIIHSIPEKRHLWYYFGITQSKYLNLGGSLTHWNPRYISTLYDPSHVFTRSGNFHNHESY